MQLSMRLKTDNDIDLPWYDNTKLVAMNTCPTYASITYGLNKRMKQVDRQLALEAGSLCHDVFAFVRLYDLLIYGEAFYAKKEGWDYKKEAVLQRGKGIFKDRWDELLKIIGEKDDERQLLIRAVLYIVNSSNYYDDPNDTRRTVTNIEDAVLEYASKYQLGYRIPVCHGDFVGVEQSFELVIDQTTESYDGEAFSYEGNLVKSTITRPLCFFVGKVDGLCWSSTGKTIELHENKTGARIDRSWEAGYEMSHQVTGYCMAANTILHFNTPYEGSINTAQMFGLAIPQSRKPVNTYNYLRHPVSRPAHMYAAWADWFWHTYVLWTMYSTNPFDAPTYTHSCNRYFSSCPLIPFCTSDREEQENMLEDMFDHIWDPREEAV